MAEQEPMSPSGASGGEAKSPLPQRRRRRSIFGDEENTRIRAAEAAAAAAPAENTPPEPDENDNQPGNTPPSSPKMRPGRIETGPHNSTPDSNPSPVTQKQAGQRSSAPPPPPPKSEQGCFSKLFSCFTTKSKMLLPESDGTRSKTLVIDLDETLVHAEFKNLPSRKYEHAVSFKWRGRVCTAYIAVRPGCARFLETMAKYYELVIFTASVQPYCDQVLSMIDPKGLIKYKLYRGHCDLKPGNLYLKDLGKLGRDMNQVVIIDDRPEAYGLHPQHAIPILSWCDDPEDKELIMATDLLEEVAKSDDSVFKGLAKLDTRLCWRRCS